MKKLCIILGVLCCSLSALAQGINFEKGNFAEALAKASRENKMLFVDAYAVWCAPCKKMDATVFKDPEVGAYFDKHIVAFKMDVERGEGIELKRKYAIEGLPGYVFLDGDGNVVFRDQSAKPTAAFMAVVKKAYQSMLDPNSIGRLAARYEKEKTNEDFLSLYLDKLKESKSKGYTDVLEQYLLIQKGVAEESAAMAKLIDDHWTAVIYGGKADDIIMKNLKSDAWQSYVRKDVRERFQEANKTMAENTSDYAILKQDTTYIDLALQRAKQGGMNVSENQRNSLLMHYYKSTYMGPSFLRLLEPEINAIVENMDIDALYRSHLSTVKKYENEPNTRFRSNAMIHSDKLKFMIKDYSLFASSEREAQNVVKWSKMVFELTQDSTDALSFYANAEYMFGDRNKGIRLKEEVLKNMKGSNPAVSADLELMRKGEDISL
ncbi:MULTISPECIES: thioredoxin family protein [Sphingobacterium]|uniref:thioredoxin family protein n=1 Tax=Sphingobacterium TaxID=28453 RepID=UPI0013D9D86A|nr:MULTISPECIES: thioredoxin family protein [unclassified Sphingobacterium]